MVFSWRSFAIIFTASYLFSVVVEAAHLRVDHREAAPAHVQTKSSTSRKQNRVKAARRIQNHIQVARGLVAGREVLNRTASSDSKVCKAERNKATTVEKRCQALEFLVRSKQSKSHRRGDGDDDDDDCGTEEGDVCMSEEEEERYEACKIIIEDYEETLKDVRECIARDDGIVGSVQDAISPCDEEMLINLTKDSVEAMVADGCFEFMDCSQLEHEMDETETSLDQCAQDDHCDEDNKQFLCSSAKAFTDLAWCRNCGDNRAARNFKQHCGSRPEFAGGQAPFCPTAPPSTTAASSGGGHRATAGTTPAASYEDE
jgi:hypothetical protein